MREAERADIIWLALNKNMVEIKRKLSLMWVDIRDRFLKHSIITYEEKRHINGQSDKIEEVINIIQEKENAELLTMWPNFLTILDEVRQPQLREKLAKTGLMS